MPSTLDSMPGDIQNTQAPMPISPVHLLVWQTVYYGAERVIRSLHQHYFPNVHSKLLASRRDLPFFGVAMGFIITFLSTPFCISAFLDESPENATAASICATSRAVLWISELSRLGDNVFYLTHHLFSLAVLVYFLAHSIPLTVLNLIFGSLVTELASDSVYLFEAHGHRAGSSQWMRTLERCLLGLYVFVKLPPIWYGCYWLKTVGTAILGPWELAFCAGSLLAYLAFNSFCIGKLAKKIGLVTMCSQAPQHVRVGQHLLTLYGVCMATGLACLATGSLIIYHAAVPAVVNDQGVAGSIAGVMSKIILASILGARLMSLVLEDGFQKILKTPSAAILRPGFWLHGGIIGAGFAIWFYGETIPESGLLISSMGICLPLYEFFSRLGCASYGCCYGCTIASLPKLPPVMHWLRMKPVEYHSPDSAVLRINPAMKGTPLVPVQTISAVLYLTQFVGATMLLCTGWCTVAVLGYISFSVHAMLRIMMETYRADFRGGGSWWTMTGAIAAVQLVGGILLAFVTVTTSTPGGLVWGQVPWYDAVVCAGTVFGFSGLIYGYNRQRIGRWI